ncbi:MAG: alpha/beta fold hydrolase [Ilumatobacter sp.]
MPVADVNGIEVYYEVHGERDAPWLLNIGGSGGDLRLTLPDRSPLNRRFRVLHYDQRGLGRTSVPDGPYSIEDYADDAAAIVEAMIVPEGGVPCHVLGTSFGGMVALNLVLRRPDLVGRMALLVTSPGGDHASFRLSELSSMDPEVAFPLRMRLLDRRWDPDAVEPIPGLGAVYDGVAARARQTPSPEEAPGLARQLAARDTHDVVDRLASISVPTFVGCGRFDDQAPMANSELMARVIPDATLQVFDAGHLCMLQDRGVMPAVGDFLAAG